MSATGTPEVPELDDDLPKSLGACWSSGFKGDVGMLREKATETGDAAVGIPGAAVMAMGPGAMGLVGLMWVGRLAVGKGGWRVGWDGGV